MKLRIFLIAGLSFYAANAHLEASYTFKNGRLVDTANVAYLPAPEHFAAGSQAMEDRNWQEAALHFNIVAHCFPRTSFGQEAPYYLGMAYFNLEEYDFANEAFSNYLKVQSNPRYFQETVEYKFCIAERFSAGAKRRFFGTKQLPKWASGQDMAVDIYDEVIATVPCHEMAARALVAKGNLLWSMKDYRGAVESFHLVIRRFPKHELAPECYLLISKLYLEQCHYEFQNPDILAFAQINARKFSRDFPREERLCQVEADVMAIKELYAKGLFDIGQFYERTCKPRAAIIYYQNTIHQFPETCIAAHCRERLNCLIPNYCEPTPSDPDEPSNDSSTLGGEPFDFDV
jgi:outer membrane protein assembly factor BamD (BamD/ComL family)